MEAKLSGQVRTLKVIVVVLVLLNVSFFISSYTQTSRAFEQLTVERLDVLSSEGKPVMVIANRQHIPGISVNGKTYPPTFSDGREQYSGIIFYNELGDEVGGLIYNGWPKPDSGYFAIEHLSFDQWKQNQVVAMQYIDNGNSRRAGLRVWDRPTNLAMNEILDRYVARNEVPQGSALRDSLTGEIRASSDRGEFGVERMFVGSRDEVAQIVMRDKQGNTRIRMYVDKEGKARLEFFDEQGQVTKSFAD